MRSFDDKLGKILDTVRSTTTQKVQRAVEEFIRMGYERWTQDRNGDHNSALAYLKAFDFFIRHHPLFNVRRIGLKNLNHETVQNVLNKIISMRGRVSHFDAHIVKTIISLLQVAGESTDGHRKFLRKLQKSATSKPRPHIKSRADFYRTALTEHCLQDSPVTSCHGLMDRRNKAVIHLLMHTPFRANTIRSLKRSDLSDDGILSIPASAMKTRKSLGFKLPEDTLVLIRRYLDLRRDDCEFLFTSISGQQPLSHNSLYKSVRKKTEQVLKQRLGIHDARRVVGTVVAKLFGSETAANLLAINIKTLQRAYDLADSSDRMEAALERIIGGRK